MGNATGIFNLLRNIGGSIGISMATTALARRSEFHQARIAASAPQTSQWFQQSTAGLTHYFGRQLSPAAAPFAALATLNRAIEQQAILWSFVDVFRWTALLAFLAALLAWLFQRVHHKKESSTVLH